MALQFDPSPYLEAFRMGQANKPTGTQTAQEIGQGLSGLGDTFSSIQEMKNKALMNQLMQTQVANAKAENTPLIPPGSQSSGSGTDMSSLMPNFQPQDQPSQPGQGQSSQGQMASAGMPDTGWGEGRMAPSQPSVVDLHNQHLRSQGLPGVGPAPLFGNSSQGSQSQPSNPEQPYLDIIRNPSETPIRQKMAAAALQRITEEEKTPYEVPSLQAGLAKTQSETQKNLMEARSAGGYDPQDMIDAKNGNWQGIASRYGGTIPSKLASLAETASTKSSEDYQRRLANAQQALIQVRGDAAITRTEEQRDAAITAYNRIQELNKSGRVMNPVDYTDILGQLYKARTGQAPPEQVMKDIRQSTSKGRFGEAYTYVTGKQAPATTQAIQDSLIELAGSMGQQADKLHEGYMAPRMAKISMGLKPEDAQQLMNAQRGLSFREATGFNGNQQSSGLMWQGRPLKDTPANRAWLAQQQGGQK